MQERELNPTLRRQPIENTHSKSSKVGDAGLDWHRRAYERCTEQAKEEQRPLNEIVSQRYGVSYSLENFFVSSQSNFFHLVHGKINVIN